MCNENEARMTNFIQEIIENDIASGRVKEIHTRFPPEPNGYLHIGHAKAICIDFLMAKQNGGICNLRFDDTNPSKEDTEYVDAIMEDIRWLGFDWDDRMFYASNYFDKCYAFAVKLIKDGKAYVEDLSAEEVRAYRGTLTEPGKDSPYRNRSIAENLDLFEKMKDGQFADGQKILRAKIDMASPNFNLRDPAIYRILRANHHRTGDKWCIYPMYDYAHPIGDALEDISHSLCTLEFEDHRPLYDWVLEAIGFENPPHQYEFARLNLTYTLTSKRKLLELVENGVVSGWDDPRMPTLSGLRRLGYTPTAIIDFVKMIGVSKAYSVVDLALLEHCLRDELNKTAKRHMVVLEPLKVVIDNYPDGQEEIFDVNISPLEDKPVNIKRPFSKVIYIEKSDFMENPAHKYFRLKPQGEVRLINAYFITCQEIIKDETGEVIEVHCTYDPQTRGGSTPPDGRKVKGTIHWVSAQHAVDVDVRLYENLFTTPDPNAASEGGDYMDNLNPNSLTHIIAKAEPALLDMQAGENCQFVRMGYFCLDAKDSTVEKPIFNRTVTLKDTWKKINEG
ncbi:MAG: glutamine--tRNA ligase/YqeY domain fusion protein [Hyphomonadaceae bacterium]|nr:glutamine--tRNA ligase/YqeY domain fusion protein [Clostridia bacterium]